jgi:hypothetical protein
MTMERPRWLLPVLIAATVLGAGMMLVDLGAMVISPMLFDSGESSGAWAMFAAIWIAPFVVLFGILSGWIGFARQRAWLATGGIALMVIPLIAGLLIFAVVPFV